jgi:hypothetical protein
MQSDNLRMFGSLVDPHSVNGSFTRVEAFTKIFGTMKAVLDWSEALFVGDSTNFCFWLANHEKLGAVAGFESKVSEAFVFAVNSVVDFEEFQFTFVCHVALSSVNKFLVKNL